MGAKRGIKVATDRHGRISLAGVVARWARRGASQRDDRPDATASRVREGEARSGAQHPRRQRRGIRVRPQTALGRRSSDPWKLTR